MAYDVALTLLRRHHVSTTSVRRRYNIMPCLLGPCAFAREGYIQKAYTMQYFETRYWSKTSHQNIIFVIFIKCWIEHTEIYACFGRTPVTKDALPTGGLVPVRASVALWTRDLTLLHRVSPRGSNGYARIDVRFPDKNYKSIQTR